ncbi:hypothetical protein NJ7G_1909 [Natrinema sp. J7-2]|nr:hypothetical protein NJ7G_1909 [Natrinema sp. J7-2]
MHHLPAGFFQELRRRLMSVRIDEPLLSYSRELVHVGYVRPNDKNVWVTRRPARSSRFVPGSEWLFRSY